ncbi:hypothetical protein VaNZ11_001344 [Volvox africanus]|uniref:Peptidase A2 domain-containing protein n=1 Tax=Volvox africanus TaxID=51714 RepID=A0ABQ5RPI0_9CHLO|nr:hypothetical protein VaNZ11_001344 [Volvox africanus]
MKALVDTGASDDFISAKEVNALGLTPQSSDCAQVTLADGGKHPIVGRITLSLSIGPLRVRAQPYVLQALSETNTFWVPRHYDSTARASIWSPAQLAIVQREPID